MTGPRTPRVEQVSQERRRRQSGTLDRTQQLKLSVPDEIKRQYPDDSFRWVNDSGTRMYDLTEKDDWSKVNGIEPIPVGTDNFGKPVFAHLCKKPSEFLKADAAEKVAQTVEVEKAIMRGQQAPEDDRKPGEAYVPQGNSLTTGFTP